MILAAAYPKSTFHGYDIAQKSLNAAARRQSADPVSLRPGPDTLTVALMRL